MAAASLDGSHAAFLDGSHAAFLDGAQPAAVAAHDRTRRAIAAFAGRCDEREARIEAYKQRTAERGDQLEGLTAQARRDCDLLIAGHGAGALAEQRSSLELYKARAAEAAHELAEATASASKAFDPAAVPDASLLMATWFHMPAARASTDLDAAVPSLAGRR